MLHMRIFCPINERMNLQYRKLIADDYTALREMFYLSLFIPEGEEPYPGSVIDLPDLSKYIEEYGREGDFGFLCEDQNKVIGAIWGRLFSEENKGFGFIDENIPELGMAVIPEYRNKGIGHQLLSLFLEEAKQRGYRAVSLSVDKRNRARKLYFRAGFEVVKKSDVDYIMMKKL